MQTSLFAIVALFAALQPQDWQKEVGELSAKYEKAPDAPTAYLLAYDNAQGGSPTDVVKWSMKVLADPGALDPVYVRDAASLLGWAEAIVDMTPPSPVIKPADSIEKQQEAFAASGKQLLEWTGTTKPQIAMLVANLPADARAAYAYANLVTLKAPPAPSKAHCYGPEQRVCIDPPPVHGGPVATRLVVSAAIPPENRNLIDQPSNKPPETKVVTVSIDPPLTKRITTAGSLRVPLSNIGIANARYLNPRNPISVHNGSDETTPWQGLIFVNDTVDRTFVVTMTFLLPRPVPTDDLDAAARSIYTTPSLSQCKPKEGANPPQMTCMATLTVHVSTGMPTEEFPAELLAADQTSGDLRTFQVRFFDETEAPSNPKGYVRTDAPTVTDKTTGKEKFQAPREPDSQTKVTPVASVALTHEPTLFLNKAASISANNPLTDSMRTHFPGAARLDVSQNIGSRANADLSFIFSSSDFGDQNDKGTVTADKYKLSVYALNRITLDYGKYVFATPASKLAISEKGQGGTLTFPNETANVALSYIVKRQGDSTLSKDLRSASDVLLQITNINVAPYAFKLFRTLNLFGLSGRDRNPDDPHSFSTTGGELFFGGSLPKHRDPRDAGYGGSLAVFHSIRTRSETSDPSAPNDVTKNQIHPHGHGTVALLKSTWNSVIDPAKDKTYSTVFVPWSISATVGAGTRSRNRTDEVDTSYIGDRSAFAPDLIFLSSLVAPISRGAAIANQLNLIGPGLSNKLYYSLEYANNEHSLLEAAAHTFGVPDNDVVSKSSRFTINRYRLLNSFLGSHDLGTELDVQFQIETPKAVKVGLGVGYFMPSRALESMFQKNVWSVTTSVSVAPQ